MMPHAFLDSSMAISENGDCRGIAEGVKKKKKQWQSKAL